MVSQRKIQLSVPSVPFSFSFLLFPPPFTVPFPFSFSLLLSLVPSPFSFPHFSFPRSLSHSLPSFPFSFPHSPFCFLLSLSHSHPLSPSPFPFPFPLSFSPFSFLLQLDGTVPGGCAIYLVVKKSFPRKTFVEHTHPLGSQRFDDQNVHSRKEI